MREKIAGFLIERGRRVRRWAGRVQVAVGREVRGRPMAFAMLALVLIVAAAALALSVAQYRGGDEQPVPRGLDGVINAPVASGDIDAIKSGFGFGAGSSYFIAESGSDFSPCTSWREACATLQHAIDVAADGKGDTIFVAPGTYDEGVVLDVDGVTLTGVGPGVTIINTNTANDGAAISVSADFVVIQRMSVRKGEVTSTNGAGIRFLDSAYAGIVEDVVISVGNAASHIGLDVTDGASGVLFRSSAPLRAGTFGVLGAGVGTGVRFDGIQNALGDITVNFFATCVHLTGNARWVQINDDTSLNSCQSQGILIDAGARDNLLDASVLNSPVKIQDDSGNATNSSRASIEALRTTVEHAADPMFPGTLYVVDGVRGKDTNSGLSSLEATRTISHTIGLLEPGDGLVIRADGVYTEDVIIATNAVQIFAAQGVEISGSVRIEADNIWNRRPLAIRNASGVAVYVAPGADNIRLDDVTVVAATTAFDLRGDNIVLRDARATGYSVAGYSFAGDGPDVMNSHAGGSGAATTGFVISSTVDSGTFSDLSSRGNGILAYDVELGASNNTFERCVSGVGDGVLTGATWRDPNLTNMRVAYDDQSDYWHHEEVYPPTPGDGTSVDLVSISSVAVEDTWGPSVIVADVGVITESWRLAGLFVSAGNGGINMACQFFVPQPQYSAQRDGGNAWSAGETVLTLDGPFQFAIGDLAWIRSSTQNEIVTVTNITGTTLVEVTALALTHPGDPNLYVVERPSSQIWSYHILFSDASAKGSKTLYLHAMRQVQPGGGFVGRLQNLESGLAVSIDTGFIYER